MLLSGFNSTNFDGRRFKFAVTLLIAPFLIQESVRAQISSDNTVNTQVQTDNDISQITGGIQSGTNLFHSFNEFSIPAGGAVNFDHLLEIENIFSRVTGGTVSDINGLIQTQGDASLFLLNPAGVIFGANAQLDIGGSFVVSTGDRLIFADGTEFSAIDPEVESLLTISAPVGLQYGGESAIQVLPNDNRANPASGLSIYPGNTLALLGGDISVSRNSLNTAKTNNPNTVGSNIEIASVKSGIIELEPDEFGWKFDYDRSDDFGAIDFSDRSSIDSNGQINLQGKTISFSAGSRILNFSQFNVTNSQIDLTATDSIAIDRGLLTTQVGQRNGLIDEAITDRGGDITFTTQSIAVSNGSIISAGTLSDGDGGSITINANDLSLFSEDGQNPALISTSTEGIGRGGSIEINTETLKIDNGSQIQALAGIGAGGTISINARSEIQLSGTGILRSRNIDGNISEQELASGFSASSGTEGVPVEEQSDLTGAGGSLMIRTPKLTIDESAQISVGSYGPANAGNIDIFTSNLNLDTAGEIVANTALAEGGSINISAEQSIILDRDSSISTTAASAGNGGNITLIAENLALLDSNRITADAKVGNGGNIYIDTQGLFIDPNSSITASSEVEQNEGTVEISTLDLNSRLATDYIEPSSLVAEDGIASGCGVGISLHSNQIRDVGRGGIPHNPFRETANIEALGDLGVAKLSQLDRLQNSKLNKADRQVTASTIKPIIEVSRWVVNSQGQVELLADTSNHVSARPCSMNPS